MTAKKAVSIILFISVLTSVLCTFGCGNVNEKNVNEKLTDDKVTEKSSDNENVPSVSKDLMEGIVPNTVNGKSADAEFILNSADFAAELFKKCALSDKGKNTLVSPLSVMLALAMTANGADGNTKAEMQKLLGGKLTEQELNEYLYAYVKALPSDEKAKLKTANSIWFRDGEIDIDKNFLQKNADYYGADAFRSAFDNGTLNDINNWVYDRTDGMIKNMLDKIGDNAMVYLINAICFDAEWGEMYGENSVHEAFFRTYDGKSKKTDMMYSEENIYISDAHAEGFIKPYAGGNYAFAALMPDEETDIYDYISGLTGEHLIKLISDCTYDGITAGIPKFDSEYSVTLNDALESMGMKEAFDRENADFRNIPSSHESSLYISRVLHKTFISVCEKGTKAGASTVVEMRTKGCIISREICLTRPFIYMIIDQSTNLPIFIGAQTNIA